MAELVVYLAGEFLAETAISYFAIAKEATFLRAAIRAGSFVLTNKAAQSMGLFDSSANELKGQTINVRSSTAPRQLIYGQSLVGGVMFYAATTGSTNEYLHTVFGLADHQIQSVEKVYFGDEDVGTVSGNVSSGRYSGKARIQHKTTGGTAYADLVSETASLTNNWTSSHKLTGISSVYVRMQYDTSIYTSIPTVRVLVKGKLVYDPRTTTTAWSDNPALCIRDYIMSDYGMRVTADEIDSASFIAAANICDETVTASGSVTQKRYTLNGVVDTSKSPREVLQDMLSTCAGMLIYSSGKYKLIAGAFSSPVQTITVDDLRGDVQLSCANEKANLFNRVVGVFADADKLYSATEYPAIASSTFKTQDGGEELTAQLDLNFTTNILEAERLAKINLLKSRQGIVVNISCKPTCLNITAGDVVALTIAQLGWSGKYFRVMEWKLNEDIGVDLVLKEEDSTAYDWSTSDAIDGAPNTSLTLIQPQSAPTNLTATNQNLSLPDGTILPAVHITWTAVSSAYVTGYELQFKLSTDTVWQSIFTSQTAFDYAGQQEVALVYNIRVRAIFSDKEGPFSSSINHTLSGDTTAPNAPTSLTAVGAYKTIQLSWTNPTAADWFYNEVWENSTNNSSTATKIGTVSSSTMARSGLPDATTKYYWLKAVDFSRNVSGFSSVATATTDSASASGDSVDIVFKRSATQPTTPSPSTGTPSGWYSDVDSVPASSDPMWSSVGTNTGSGTNYTWQTPLLIEGQDGTNGTDGLSVAEVSIFKRSATTISTAPTGGSFNFSTNTLTPPSTWSATVPSGTDPVYISRSVASISGTTGTDSTLTWSTPTISFQNGIDGTDGTDGATGATGPRNAQVYFYYNTGQSTAPTAPTTSQVAYDFSTQTPSISASGWSTTFSPSAVSATSASNKYWAVRVIFQETTFGGAYSETISSVFTWQNLNGLVTFTNLADGLGSGGTGTTFIDGGSIVADTLSVSKIQDNTSATFNSFVTFGLGTGSAIGGYSAGGAFSSSDISYYGGLFANTSTGFAIGAGTRNTTSADIGAIVAVGYGNSTFSTFRHAAYLGTGVSAGTFMTGGASTLQTAVNADIRLAYYTGGTSYAYYINSGAAYPFTAGHDALQLLTEDVPDIGDIMVDVELIAAPTVNDSITKMTKSTSANQKGAIGVFTGVCGNEFVPASLGEYVDGVQGSKNVFVMKQEYSTIYETYRPIGVNAIGEGKINVCGQGGDIQIGDFIVTSDIAGKGMKQADDIARSYTVAKARENVSFANSTEIRQIACIYLCG